MAAPTPTPPKSSARPRQLCLRALLEWEKGKSFSDEILQNLFARTASAAPGDRGWVMESFFGILRHLTALDFWIDHLRGGGHLEDQTRAILRLGLYQLFFQRTPAHAAVNETVALAGAASRGLVNAILRRAAREQQPLERRLADAPREVRLSHPEFLLARWDEQFGPEATLQLAAWNNLPAEIYVRANGLRTTADDLLARPDAEHLAERISAHPKALKVRTVPLPWIEQGLCYVQDPSTLLACDLLDPQPGETVLDMCAAPGGKATYLAELIQNRGRLVASDLYDSRLERLRENLQRLGATVAEVTQQDAMKGGGALQPDTFDRILLDAPCTNTGVLRRRVDVRWRLTTEDFLRLPVQQAAMVRRAAGLLKPGGTLVYSTCSLEREENERVVAAALAALGGKLRLEETRNSLPFRDGLDGAFAARLVRIA